MEALQEVGVATAPVFTIGEAYHDPHDTFRRTSVNIEIPEIRTEDVTYGIPWRLSETPGAIRSLGRPIGADDQAFLVDLMGLSPRGIEQLNEQGVTY